MMRGHVGRPTVSRWGRVAVACVAGVALSASLAAFVAVLLDTILFGRVPIAQLVRGWTGSVVLTVVFVGVVAWWLIYLCLLARGAHRVTWFSALLPTSPLIIAVVVPVVALYLSDLANHYFYVYFIHMNQPKALALLLIDVGVAILLQGVALEMAKGHPWSWALQRAVMRLGDPMLLSFLGALGMLQSAAYLTVLANDFLRYWTIADGLVAGFGYPATLMGSQYVVGGMTSYIVDMPLYAVMLIPSFALLGHTAAAAYLPVVASNVLLPPFAYLLFREVVASRVTALSLAALVVLFPPLRFHSLNWTEPDATFYAVLMGCSWLFARIVKGDKGRATWTAFGILAASTALSRPEGAAYAGIYLLAVLLVVARKWCKVAAIAAFCAPVGAFSLTMILSFGLPWPHNWVGSLGPANIMANASVLAATTLGVFAESIRVSPSQLVIGLLGLLLLALIGSWPSFYHPRWLALLVLPAWVNLLSVVMVDPRVSGAYLWYDFFRHASFPLPMLTMAAGMALVGGIRLLKLGGPRTIAMVLLNAMLVVGVLWNVNFLTRPSWNFGGYAGNLLGSDRVDLVDVLFHPLELPKLGFERVDGHLIATSPQEYLSRFPSQAREFFAQYDPVRRTAGTPYETGSLCLYLAALALALLPRCRIGVTEDLVCPGLHHRSVPKAFRE